MSKTALKFLELVARWEYFEKHRSIAPITADFYLNECKIFAAEIIGSGFKSIESSMVTA